MEIGKISSCLSYCFEKKGLGCWNACLLPMHILVQTSIAAAQLMFAMDD